MMPDQPQPQVVAPQPVPTMFFTNQVRTEDGTLLVQLSISTPTGMHITFLEQTQAKALGEQLFQAGAQGLVIADSMPGGAAAA